MYSAAPSPSASHPPIPGSPISRDYSGPWFRTQLLLSLSLGLVSFIAFSLLRGRWRTIYQPRALLHAAEPADPASAPTPGLFGWIAPTWRVTDRTLLDTVGLDAVVFLDFLKTSAVFFSVCAASAAVVLMPVNWTRHGSTDSDTDVPGGNATRSVPRHPAPTRNPTLLDIIIDPQTTISLHLLFTYFFSLLALYLLHKNYHRFLLAKQTFSLARKSSTPARTVLVSSIPRALRSERALHEYFEHTCGWPVEAVQVVRHVGTDLRDAIREREYAMRQLERAWWVYQGGDDPVTARGRIRLEDNDDDEEEEPSYPTSTREGSPSSGSSLDPFSSTNTPGVAAVRSSAPSLSAHQIEIPVLIDDPEDPSPNWGEVRTGHDLPRTAHAYAVAAPTSPLPPTQKPTTAGERRRRRRSRPTKRIGPPIPCLGHTVDAITYWQTAYDEATARVQAIRKAHEADKEGDVTFARGAASAVPRRRRRSRSRERVGGGGQMPVDVEGQEERGWLSGWIGPTATDADRDGAGADDDGETSFARVRFTEEGRALVSDHHSGHAGRGVGGDSNEDDPEGIPVADSSTTTTSATRTGKKQRDSTAAAAHRRNGPLKLSRDPWRPSGEAFVTFQSITSAELAAQVVHFPEHSQCRTELAPDPDDIVWANMGKSSRERLVRRMVVWAATAVILLFWIPPVSALATLLSFKEIERVLPWLANWIEASPTIGALVQTTLPSTAIIIFNAALPYVFEWLCYWQGFRSRSEIANSILKKYTMFLLLTTIFIFLLVSTIWAIFLDLAGSPQKIPEKLAHALTQPNARAFAMSFVLLQAIGIMPLQLLNIGSLFWIAVYRVCFRLTPRELVELYAPPSVNYGMIYPPAILVFIFTLTDSVISPLILIFGAIYFAVGYMVYKYKLIYVFVNPYESTGEAWPTTFARLVWGIVLFELFMLGLFAARQSWFATTGLVPLLLGTIGWSWTVREDCRGLSQHVPLATIAAAEAEHGEDERPISIRYRKTNSPMYRQAELAERLPKPWISAHTDDSEA